MIVGTEAARYGRPEGSVDKKLIAILGLLALLALPAVQLGCAAGDPANASTSEEEATEAEGAEGGAEGENDDERQEEAVPVEVTELQRGTIESVLSFSSNLEAESEVQVFSQAKRLVTKLHVEEGDRVNRGALLLRLQDEEQRSDLAKVTSQLHQAEREYARQKRLFEQDLISEQEYNDATYDLEQLRLSLEDAERELGYTEVRAPIAGTVTARLVNLGDQVQIGEHLFDIVDFNSIVSLVYVPEKHLQALQPRLPARISTQATGGREYSGVVKRISPIVDPQSGTVKVTIDVGGQPGLRPGMYVDVDLVMAENEEAVLVPKQALVYDNDQMFVYRLQEERRVERIFVEPLLSDKFFIEPVEGLDSGDQVVIAGQAGLKDGALVSLPGDEPPEEEEEETDS
jgi:membrane fusion protein (multidrug efflux system)